MRILFFLFIIAVIGCSITPLTEKQRAERAGVTLQKPMTAVVYHSAVDDAAIIAVAVGMVTAADTASISDTVIDAPKEQEKFESEPSSESNDLSFQPMPELLNAEEEQETIPVENTYDDEDNGIPSEMSNPEIPIIPVTQMAVPVLEETHEEKEPLIVESASPVPDELSDCSSGVCRVCPSEKPKVQEKKTTVRYGRRPLFLRRLR
ncbi:MAG: hypothetical protein LBT46_04830 [Planctomycetaceae bacterium]|jgi:hypothetical protein|nr:hypothetical protein [Planctomycetaceae bacterium]